MFRSLSFALVLLALPNANAQIQRGDPLPRKGFFGVATSPDAKGLKIARVYPGGLAEKLNLTAGDLILTVNGKAMPTPGDLVALAGTLHGGDPVELKVVSSGKEQVLNGRMVARPFVQEEGLEVIYDQVMSQGKRIRVIVTKPQGAGKFPCLFMIGGVGGYSVDAPYNAAIYGQILGPISKQGYVVVRVDKPGQGDSEGPLYKDLKFSEEADAYLQALRLTKSLPFVDPGKIAIFGHSMGGCFAPIVASQEPVKAIAVSGTLFKTFEEYMLENIRRQSELAGVAPDDLDETQRQFTSVMHFVFDENQAPNDVAKKHPELALFIKDAFRDGETYSGVGVPFFRELAQTNLPKAWAGVSADVLAIYDENDFLSGRDDHERIAAFMNKQRPGSGDFKVLPGIDHYFTKTTSKRDSMEKAGKGEFNPIFVETLSAFLKKELG